VPHTNSLRQACQDRGAATSVTTKGTGPLKVSCTASFRAGDMLMASNMTTAALLTQPTLGGTTLGYSESSLSGFSNAPEKGGFQVGDLVYPVTAVHYYVATAPMTGRPALYRSLGTFQSSATGAPFIDTPNTETLVMHDVEDLQVAFGVDPSSSGNPDNQGFVNTLAPDYVAGLRSIRVSVVALSKRKNTDAQTKTVKSAYAPMTVEDHTPTATADGYRRSLYSRRVELLNLDPVNL
jgi:hypothetical protein